MSAAVEAPAPAEWVLVVEGCRNVSAPGLHALCRELLTIDDVPPALRALASAAIEQRIYRADRPRARAGDPETSQAAAERHRTPPRAGGTVHRLLRTYAEHADAGMLRRECGLTSKEVEVRARVKAAHKRTSELLADGLLRVVTRAEKGAAEYEVDTPARCEECTYARNGGQMREHEHPDPRPVENPDGDAVRGGGRILRITDDGRAELARMNREKLARDAERERVAEVRRVRAERRGIREAKAAMRAAAE